jgi:hypothetical protein
MVKKGSGLKKANTIIWIIFGVLSIILTIYTFTILMDLQGSIP